MNNGHNLSYERSSGYNGFRCSNCGEWFYDIYLNLRPCPVLKAEHSVKDLCHDFYRGETKTVKFPTSIYSPDDIEVGKKYENSLCSYVTYLGCQNYDTLEKFMIIIDGDDDFTGQSATNDITFPIWRNGFYLK